MASMTRRVLTYFDQSEQPISLNHLAQELGITHGVLESILQYWVKKGQLREVTSEGAACQSCGIQNACPFVTTLPTYYERANSDHSPTSCSCKGACH